ncbi:hypothetical protein N8J89_12870 [Crossiella sp. CA-258035]|uniref:hypothetical protein n=1 Tax=Crossiella sp. CA-258035 TaxID=2981138 RepID=UPI0024BCBFFE|nr:hypothetical protein [Crossiella sp. CA-258035]WHT21913.1 hypothetical protein N8J89_12870 [Crossiella sp. CA-258035]
MDRHWHPDAEVPAYGSPAWHALPEQHPHRHRALLLAAEAWRRYWSPEMVTLRAEEAEQQIRARLRALAFELSEAMPARFIIGPSYRELAARQMLRSILRCGQPACTELIEITHPFPARWLDTDGYPAPAAVRCPAHDTPGIADQAPESGVRSPRAGAVRPSTALSAPHSQGASRPARDRLAAEGTAA